MPNADEVATNAYNTAKTALNSFDPAGTASKQLNTFKGLWGDQQGQTDSYIKQYTDTIKSNPSVTDLYNQGNEKFNVQGLGKTANYLQNEVTNAIPSGYQAARGTDIGNAQVQNGVATRLQYLNPQSNAATNNLQTAQGLAQGYVESGVAQNATNLLPVQAQGQMLSDAFARQQSGYTTSMQTELDGLKAKLAAGMQLSQAEYDRANTLTQAETAFKTAQMQAENQMRVAQEANRYQTVAPGSNLINTFTNSIINPATLTGSKGYARV